MSQTVRMASLLDARAVGFDAPFDMLEACHERVQRSLALLQRLRAHVRSQGVDDDARQAARDVLRYFDLAAPLHHEDEELHVFPLLLARGPASVHTVVRRLQQDHQAMKVRWQSAREVLSELAQARLPGLSLAQEQALEDFAALYADHILAEESIAYPGARSLIEPATLAEMGREMARRRGAG